MGKRRITLLVAASLVASLGTGTLGRQVASATPRSPKVATTDYFFHGTPADQANKGTAFANMQPPPADSLTFDTSNTLDATPVTQNNQSPNAGFWPNSLAVYWTGPFSGTINGDVTFNIYWSTSNPEAIALGVDMDVKVIADTDFTSPGAPGPGTIIGEATPTFTVADTTPKLITVTVPVSGAVTNELFIQFASLFSDTGSGLTAYYDNASFPSMFSVPASQVSVSIA